MRLFSIPAKRKPPAAVRPEAGGPAEVVSITNRRIEITVEREWTQSVEAGRPVEDDPSPADQPKELS